MKIALLFDGASALGKSPDLLILETVEAVEAVLAAEGNQVVRVPVHTDGRWIERVRRTKCDVAFNLCEGIDGVAELEPTVISALEVLGIPFTGSSSWTTSLCLRKHVVNAILDRSRLPIPRFAIVRRGDPIPAVGFPAICKPAAEDASVGVEQRSVVRTMRALAERVSSMHERWDEVLVQRYIDGREVNVGIVGDQVLPVSEIHFGAMPKGMWRIVSYRSKWDVGSDEDSGAQPQCPAELAERSHRRAAAHRAPGVARGGRRRLRPRRLPHRSRGQAVDSRGELESRSRAGRGARAHGARGGARLRRARARDLRARIAPRAPVHARSVGARAAALRSRRAGRQPRARALRRRAALSGIAHAGRAARLVGSLAPHHRERLVEILEATGAFAPAEIDVALELFDDGMRSAESYELMGVFNADGALQGYACWGPTPGTDGGYDLYWIAVDPRAQGGGYGSTLMRAVEELLRGRGARLLVAETSSRASYAADARLLRARRIRGTRARARVLCSG